MGKKITFVTHQNEQMHQISDLRISEVGVQKIVVVHSSVYLVCAIQTLKV